MSIATYETRITHRYLMRRTKDALATWIEQLHRTLGTKSPDYATLMGWAKFYLAQEVLHLSKQLPEETN